MSSAIDSLLGLVTSPGFLGAAAAGFLALGGLFLVPPPARWWASSVAGATVVGLVAAGTPMVRLVLGVAVLAVGGHLAFAGTGSRAGRGPIGWMLLVVGAVVVAGGWGDEAPRWVPWVGPVVVLAGGRALAWWRDQPGSEWLGPLVALSAGGLWAVVPDTESVAALVGAAGALAVATIPGTVRITAAGSFALVGLFVWLTVDGGIGRAGSIVGGWAVLGIVALLPLMHVLLARAVRVGSPMLVLAHLVLVLVASRVLGRATSAMPVLLGVAVLWLLVGASILALSTVSRRGRSPGVS